VAFIDVGIGMQQTFALESKLLAEELHALLVSLDPAAWRDEHDAVVRSRFERMMDRLKAALSTHAPAEHPRLDRIRQKLHDVASLADHAPSMGQSAARLRHEWQAFRSRAYLTYDGLAASLRHEDIHVPVLRPTNYYRNIFHVSSGLVALVCILHLASPVGLIWIAASFATFCWSAETGRKFSPKLNQVLMTFFGPMAHQHEYHRVNSATWYATALLVLALFTSPMAAALAVVVLAFGDPAAALVGRRWGRTKIRASRSLEGTLAFTGVGGLMALAVLLAYYPALTLGASLMMALACGLAGALAELFSQKLDDNFTVPVAVGAAATVMMMMLVG
jgi:dolichol kinase